MSRESLQWLNTNTLIGFTDQRGHAWHWRAQEQNGTSNHYPRSCRTGRQSAAPTPTASWGSSVPATPATSTASGS